MNEIIPQGFWDRVSDLFGFTIIAKTKLNGGRNNQIFRVDLSDGRVLVVKRYALIDFLGRDRRKTEYDAITFMSRNGVRNVPAPLGTDPVLNIALYKYISGNNPRPDEVDQELVDSIHEFFCNLKSLKGRPGAEMFGNASEAFFNGPAIVENLKARLDRLDQLKACGKVIESLHTFVSEELRPSAHKAIESALNLDRDLFECILPRRLRMLSPSDVGFHNILRDRSSKPVFLDFEYFGWDDPAKMIIDFLTQHEFELLPSHGERFLALMLDTFKEDVTLRQRLKIYFPIFRAKKAVIALNEFLHPEAARREFSSGICVDDGILNRQIAVARNVLSLDLPATNNSPNN